MRHVPEGAEELLSVRMHDAVRHDLALKQPQLLPARQSAVYEQIRRLEVGRVLSELLNWIATIAEDPCVAIDIRDLALDDGGVEKAFVRHAKAFRRLVLYTFTLLELCGNCLEGRR